MITLLGSDGILSQLYREVITLRKQTPSMWKNVATFGKPKALLSTGVRILLKNIHSLAV